MTKAETFIKTYGGPYFDNVVFRKDPMAKYTALFGIDKTTGDVTPIRVHLGVDRAKGKYGLVWAPFRGIVTISKSDVYGSLFRINVENDFEIRIGHMFTRSIRFKNGDLVKAGELIGDAGKEGLSTGVHTHTECVSLNNDSEICESILEIKKLPNIWFSDNEIGQMAVELLPILKKDIEAKAISKIGPHKIVKFDPWTKKVQTYYDVKALFNI